MKKATFALALIMSCSEAVRLQSKSQAGFGFDMPSIPALPAMPAVPGVPAITDTVNKATQAVDAAAAGDIQ